MTHRLESLRTTIVGQLEGRKLHSWRGTDAGIEFSPSELNFRANIYGIKTLGVERIVSVSAVGSLKEEHKPLDFVIPDQFVDRTRGRIYTFFGEGLVAHVASPIRCARNSPVVDGAAAMPV